MLIPRYWANKTGAATLPSGKSQPLMLWGWSQESLADAQAMVQRRWTELLARLAGGEPPARYAYGKLPLREEILETLGEPGSSTEAVITRNLYGALVLNTAQVPFIDIDEPRLGCLAALKQMFKRKPDVAPVLAAIREACQRSGHRGFRIYRTCAGYRVLATQLLLDPQAENTQQLLDLFGADPFFTKLCRLQSSFRARLTPKPWRCGHTRPPGRYPWDVPAVAQQFQTWLTRYEQASQKFATCRYLETFGPEASSDAVRAIVRTHDRMCKVHEDLPLA